MFNKVTAKSAGTLHLTMICLAKNYHLSLGHFTNRTPDWLQNSPKLVSG
ncbi:uncharacterized protein METZ01_LOCUS488282, partial [marine metagenome]